MAWEQAERVQKNDAGEYRAFIGGEWIPVAKAQKNDAGQFRVERIPAPKIESPQQASTSPEVPQWGRENPTLYGVVGAARETLGPIAEALGTAAGAVAGTVGGTPGLGTIVGAGAGYAGAAELLHQADLILGNVAPQSMEHNAIRQAKNILVGGSMEAGGRAAAPLIEGAIKTAAGVVGKFGDMFQMPLQKAAKIARASTEGKLAEVQSALRTAPEGATASQALATDLTSIAGPAKPAVNVPVTQALLQRSEPRAATYFSDVAAAQQAQERNMLAQMAGGGSQAAARGTQAEMKNALNKQLIPTLETELSAANAAGKYGVPLQAEADRLAAAAANKVQDVRRFTAVQGRAPDVAESIMQQRYPGQVKPPFKFTYQGEQAVQAEKVAADAAEGSLKFGEAARFKQAAADSLAAYGLKPLKAEAVTSKLSKVLSDPKLAESDAQTAVKKVIDGIETWTKEGGVIDAWALDSIRKNSVNAAIRNLYPAADSKTQKKLAAEVLTKIKPVLVKAIEDAGGTGYGKYLSDYAAGMQEIAKTKLSSEALKLYNKSPKQFVELVENNSPKIVEKILGPGNYNIAQELSQETLGKLQSVSGRIKATDVAKEQASKGQDALVELYKDHLVTSKLPNWMSRTATTTNTVIDAIETRMGKATMKHLTEAAKTAKSFDELLSTLPAIERNKFLKMVNNPSEWGVSKLAGKVAQENIRGGMFAGTTNALSAQQNQNALAQ